MQPQRVKLTQAAFARLRGVAKSTVCRQVAAGLIPVDADGLIDAATADEALARRSAKAPRRGSLAEARRRKVAATVALLQDEVEALEASAAPRAEIVEAWRAMAEAIRERFEGLMGLGPNLAGQGATEASEILTEAVHAALEELSEAEIVAVDADGNVLAPDAGRDGSALKLLTMIQLAARRADLQARRLEHRRAVRRGHLVEFCCSDAVIERRLGEIRSRALAAPTRVAPLFATLDCDGADAALRDELDEILEALERPLLEELEKDAC